jgi:signal transduction histidine kinase
LADRLERLVSAEAGLIAELSLDTVLQRIADLAAEIIGARFSAVGLLAPDGQTLDTFTTHGVSPEERAAIGAAPRGHGILGLVIREGRAIRLHDLTQHPASHGFPPHHPPMTTFLAVPIVGRRGVLGDLYLTEKQGADDFNAEDEHLAQLLATKAAAVIENARLHEESARLLEEVQQLQRLRERFFAMVNHELRNALAGVFGWAEMLVRKKDPQTVPRAAYEVLDAAERAISLINDLLDLSRLDEDRLRPVIREVDCVGSVRQAFTRVTPAATNNQVQLTMDLPAEMPTCRTDASRLEQILVNLLGNAIRHSPEGGTVRLVLQADDASVVFRVEDDGPGVAPEDVDRIFDIYHSTGGEASQGVGLGLPLSRRLARLLGGDLRAEARSGRGGCFVLEIPIAGRS